MWTGHWSCIAKTTNSLNARFASRHFTWTFRPFSIRSLRCHETRGTYYQVTRRHIPPEEQVLQPTSSILFRNVYCRMGSSSYVCMNTVWLLCKCWLFVAKANWLMLNPFWSDFTPKNFWAHHVSSLSCYESSLCNEHIISVQMPLLAAAALINGSNWAKKVAHPTVKPADCYEVFRERAGPVGDFWGTL